MQMIDGIGEPEARAGERKTCIYDATALPSQSNEHFFNDCWGGNRGSHKFICDDCNGAFAGSVDAAFVPYTDWIFNAYDEKPSRRPETPKIAFEGDQLHHRGPGAGRIAPSFFGRMAMDLRAFTPSAFSFSIHNSFLLQEGCETETRKEMVGQEKNKKSFPANDLGMSRLIFAAPAACPRLCLCHEFDILFHGAHHLSASVKNPLHRQVRRGLLPGLPGMLKKELLHGASIRWPSVTGHNDLKP